MVEEFSEEDRIKILLWSDRHCCLCDKACVTNIVVHHIEQEGDNLSDIDNAIPLCLDCHGKIKSYSLKHPVGTDYKVREIKARRNQIYEKYTKHLVPPLVYYLTPQRNNPIGQDFSLPIVGFVIENHGNLLPAKFKVNTRVFLGAKELKPRANPRKPYYIGGIIWNLNARHTFFGNFKVPEETVKSNKELRVEVQVTVIDQYDRTHELLPVCFTYVRDKKFWYLEPTSSSEFKRFMTS